jgi:peptide/nickel transport system permease protein
MRVVARRLATLVLVLVVSTFLTALLTSSVRGDTVDAIAATAPPATKAQIRHDLHLDEGLLPRYWIWLNDFAHGDLGKIYTGPTTNSEVTDKVKEVLPTTLKLMLYSQVLALLLAIPLGVITAYRAGSLFDKATNASAFGLLAIPNFVVALVLAYYLGVKYDVVPPIYNKSLTGIDGNVRNFLLPTISLAVGQVAIYLRLLRSDMIATLQEDYITMAKAKGLTSGRILWRHALRPSSLTLVTAAGLNIGTLIGGAVVIETIFAMPGMGYEIAKAIAARQYVALQSYVAIIAIGYILVNGLVDVLYAILDPRIRRGRST